MMLVAAREFRQITHTRSFWITLLLLPLAIGVSQAMAILMAPKPGVAYVIVDQSGRFAPAIDRRVQVDQDRQVLGELSAYAAKWKIAPADPTAVWAQGARYFSETDVAAFEAAGGLPKAAAEIARLKPKGAPELEWSAARFLPADPPPRDLVADQGPERFGASLAPHLKDDVPTADGPRPLALGVYIPANLGQPGATGGVWTAGRPNGALIELVRGEITRQLRRDALRASGVDVTALARAEAVTAPVALHVPPMGAGRERIVLQSALPLALSYLLLMSLMISGAWMLQGLMEERSNKLLETVLACISPNDLLFGKLVGVTSVGMVMILTWIAVAVGAAFAFSGVVADFLRPALASLDSPWIGLALLYFFVAGYLAISMLFLAVGSISENMRDAQGYLTPMILLLTLPFVALMRTVLVDPDGPLPRILSWIPLYTPFAMMARLGGGVSGWEVAGSALMLGVSIWLELLLIGRLFRATLLQSGEPVRLKDVPRLILAAGR
jgi:ABC-type Na+ efflux pump permease subunit